MQFDKNTVIGITLIILVFLGFSYYNTPSQEQLEARRHYIDSVNAVNQKSELAKQQEKLAADSLKAAVLADSAAAVREYGNFASCASGKEQTVTLHNDFVLVELSTKGGAPTFAQLNEYTDFKNNQLVLIERGDNNFNLELPTADGKVLNTADMFFAASEVTDSSAVFTLNGANGAKLVFRYKLAANSYMLNFDIETVGLRGQLLSAAKTKMQWASKVRQNEKSFNFENRYAALTWKLVDDSSTDDLSYSSKDSEVVDEPIRWIAFKDQFFSTIFISDSKPILSADLKSDMMAQNSGYLKSYRADVDLDMDPTQDQTLSCRYFMGPLKYTVLRDYDDNLDGDQKLKLHHILPLGMFLLRWICQLIIIPSFSFLSSFISNYGLIIFLLTLLIKVIILPFTRSSYMSTAKMRALAPEIKKLQEKIPEENMAERQQVSMQVYAKAGVNPMGGCLPMLLQMPFLIAMFWFFPAAIELRGQSFLFADDLSTYDDIINWGVNLPLIGDHLSLFCLAFTLAQIASTKMNMSMSDTGAQQQMPAMKYMMYLMPVVFFFMFNDYASGLCLYYFYSTILTFIIMFAFRKLVDEEKLLMKINEKAEKNKMSTSRWMSTLQAMQEEMERQKREAQSRSNKRN